MQKKDFRICKKLNTGRQFISLLAVFLLCAQLSAHSGMFWGEKNLRVAKTQWFDIIYPERCEKSAVILYEKADTVYEEVAGQYGLIPSFRMPVVITPAVEQFNAFWTAIPYNHIAIYDTSVAGSSELAVFSETLLSTFRHELTHAVTYNMKSGFWRGVGKIFGDGVAPGMLTVTTGMAEGATVTSESAAGEGRLNDEYAKHYVKQAKIEGAFPSYHDVSGSADNSPSGAPYFFNGAFHQWLQEKYGMEPYAEFWYRIVNGKNLTVAKAFKKSFGVKLRTAWNQFEEAYEVPEVAANPVKAGLSYDFFEPERSGFSRLNDAGSLYGSLSSAGGRLVWLDKYGSRVFEADGYSDGRSSSKSPAPAVHELFSQQGISGVRLSNDGRFLAVSYMSENAPGPVARIKLYDFDRKSFYSVKEKGLKDGVVVKDGAGGFYLVAQKYFDQNYSIVIYKLILEDSGRRVKGTELHKEIKLDVEINPFAFTALNNGAFAWIKKNRLTYSLCVTSLDGAPISEFVFPEGMTVRSLSYAELSENSALSPDTATFYFSYAQKGTLPRLGKLEVDGALGDVGHYQPEKSVRLILSSQDISGGIFEPVLWNGKIVYIGKFLRQNRVLCLRDGTGSAEIMEVGGAIVGEAAAAVEDMTSAENSGDVGEVSIGSLISETTPYKPFPYLLHGIFMPLSTYQSEYFGTKETYASNIYDFMIGATYITANPWTSGTDDLYTLTAGFNPVSLATGVSLTINKGTETSLFKSQTAIKSEFNKNGWQHGGIVSDISSVIETGRISSIIITNTATALFNSQSNFSVSDTLKLQYSNIRKTGPGRFERGGFGAAVGLGKRYIAPLASPDKSLLDLSVVSAGLKICIPHLLPFESKYGSTYNLPLTAGFTLLPSSSNYGYVDIEQDSIPVEGLPAITIGHPVFDASVEVVAFSMDIQKALPGITAVYLNDFYINLGYSATGTAGSASKNGFQAAHLPEYFGAISDGRGYYLDSAYIKTGLELTPNVGLFASPNYQMELYVIYSYTIHSYKELNPQERIRLLLGFSMNGF